MPDDVIEALARQAHAARRGAGPEGLAAGQGLAVRVLALPAVVVGLRPPGEVIAVDLRRRPSASRAAVLRELAHHMLREHASTRADVWALAVALGDRGPKSKIEHRD